MQPAAIHLGVGVGVMVAALAASGCSTESAGPACTNESSAVPYTDAGILPLRALPSGFPCATGAVCYATIDDCTDDWPDAASAPASPSATPFVCDCPDGVWACSDQSPTPPVCVGAPVDAGAG
jgi:hypothetical protein